MKTLTLASLAVGAILAAGVAPVRAQSGPVVNQNALLRADGIAQIFGSAVAISGHTAVVGAFGSDDNGDASGAAFVFVRDANGDWTQQAKLLPDDGAAGDFFGDAVAIGGDTAIIAASEDDDNGKNSGSAYIFTRDTDGVWTQQAKLLASDGATNDFFGESVAISGDAAIVGARGDDDNGSNSGSAYVFTRDADGIWTQQAKLLPNDGSIGDFFGGASAVAIEGDTVFVGAALDDDACPDNVNCNSGSAYVFTRDADGLWTQRAKLLASDGQAASHFGNSVAVSGDTAVIGAFGMPYTDMYHNSLPGAAYIFARDPNGLWTQQAELVASDEQTSDEFAGHVAVSGDTALVGARLADYGNLSISGSAYVFTRDADSQWTQLYKLIPSDAQSPGEFGGAVSISGDTALVGAYRTDNGRLGGGSAYIFDLTSPAYSPDLNGNGVVDGIDLAALLMQWGTDGGADLNGDGVVDGVDLATLLTNWG